jgi:hypothetical protein
MPELAIAARFTVSTDRLRGCTPWLTQLLWLYSYCRCVVVNRRQQHLIVSTRRCWLFSHVRCVPFSEVTRIVYRAQRMPSLSPLRNLLEDGPADWAVFFISLGLKQGPELPLFTVWQRQTLTPEWLQRLAGERPALELGDEAASDLVELLHRYIGVPVAQH